MKNILLFLIVGSFFSATAQSRTKRVLFLGNSYTYVNNLPQMLADVALSVGDTVIFDSNAPGGYTLQGHSTNATSLAKIALGNWDYVVLQEQSQLPSFPIGQVETSVFPYAHILDSLIRLSNPSAETVFYMTWGRENGDADNCPNWPPVCTYAGMDSLLNLRYRMMADDNHAIISPVGAVWRYIRQMFPGIGLYQVDGSHPSVAGTYAAACCFYSALFRKDPTAITYNPSLPLADAANIRAAAKLIVFDSLMNWHIGEYDPLASFSYLNGNGESSLVVYPNPAKDILHLVMPFSEGCFFEIFNLMGDVVQIGRLGHLEKQIEVGALADGVYILKLRDGVKTIDFQNFVKKND